MDRISTTSKAVDLFGAGKHGFKDGNLSLGITPTDFNADWFNGVQEELLNVIEAAGIVPAAATRNQLLTALRGSGLFQTATQFNNGQRVATTEFVQRALGNSQASAIVNVAGNFQASDAGSAYLLAAAGNYGLPMLSSVPAGATFTFMATVNGVVVSRQGTDVLGIGSGTANTVPLQSGDTAVFVKFGTMWALMGGSAANRNSLGDFGRAFGVSGWQMLPGGLINQWGSVTTSASADLAVNYPIAFPSEVWSRVATVRNGGGSGAFVASIGAHSLGSFSVGAYVSNTAARASVVVDWMAIGK